MEASLKRVIDEELARLEKDVLDPLEQELAGHAAFLEERARLFLGREQELQVIAEQLSATLAPTGTTAASAPLIVRGAGGSGKSALLAKATQAAQTAWPQAVIVCRFIGATPRSGGLFALLADLLADLARRYGTDETLPEGDIKALIDELPGRLALATAEKPLILVLDALDQLGTADMAHYLHWLPNHLPDHVAVVLSVLEGPVADTAARRYPGGRVLTLPGLDAESAAHLLDTWLGAGDATHRPRTLQAAQKETILQPFQRDGRPLYLRIAAALGRDWCSWDTPPALPASLEELIHHLFARLQRRHGEVLAERALAYLAAARHGLSDGELTAVLWRDVKVRAEFEAHRHPDQPEVDALPPVVWSRLVAELAPYLTQTFQDDALLHRFFHGVLGQVVSDASLSGASAACRHRTLAQYFRDQPLYLGDHRPNARKLMEEPRHWLAASDAAEAERVVSDFEFGIAKCLLNRSDDWAEDFRLMLSDLRATQTSVSEDLSIWANFVCRNAHLLRRGNVDYQADKILLQLAIEHADSSPLTGAAERFLSQEKCDWYWLRRVQRPRKVAEDRCLAVLEGHADVVLGALVLADGRLLSWSRDRTLRLWGVAADLKLV